MNTPELSFNLTPAADAAALCPRDGERLVVLTPRDEPSRSFLATWRYWCPRCQNLTLTRAEAEAALASLEPGAIGAVVACRLPLDITHGAAPA